MHPALDPKNNPQFAKVQEEVIGDAFTVSPPQPDALPPTDTPPADNIVDQDPQLPQDPEPTPIDDGLEGFKSYDQYIADGGDPRYFRGEEAYKQQKQLIQEKKDSEQKLKGRLDAMEQQLVNLAVSNEQQRAAEINSLKAEIEAARESGDTEAMHDAYQKLSQAAPAQQPANNGPMPSVQEFIQSDERLQKSSPNFNQKYHDIFDAMLARSVNNAIARTGTPLTDIQMRQHLQSVHDQLNEDPVINTQTTLTQNRNRPQKVGAPRGNSQKADPIQKMKEAGVHDLYKRWSTSRKANDKAMAERLKKKYGG